MTRIVPVIDIDAVALFETPNLTGTPERNLLLAILERAILDFVGNNEKEVRNAEEWLFEDLNPPTAPQFSFPWLCVQLELDQRGVADKIRGMPKRGARKIAPWYFARNTESQVTG